MPRKPSVDGLRCTPRATRAQQHQRYASGTITSILRAVQSFREPPRRAGQPPPREAPVRGSCVAVRAGASEGESGRDRQYQCIEHHQRSMWRSNAIPGVFISVSSTFASLRKYQAEHASHDASSILSQLGNQACAAGPSDRRTPISLPDSRPPAAGFARLNMQSTGSWTPRW